MMHECTRRSYQKSTHQCLTHTYVLSITISLAHEVFVTYVLCGIIYGALVIFYDFFHETLKTFNN